MHKPDGNRRFQWKKRSATIFAKKETTDKRLVVFLGGTSTPKESQKKEENAVGIGGKKEPNSRLGGMVPLAGATRLVIKVGQLGGH